VFPLGSGRKLTLLRYYIKSISLQSSKVEQSHCENRGKEEFEREYCKSVIEKLNVSEETDPF
jgi:hypothetical protein